MNNNDKIRDKQESSVISGFAWKLAERFLAQIITFLVSIILARLLAPDDYGVISIVLIFITFSDVLVSNGFGTALIQKKDANEVDFSTLFYCSFFVSIIIYILIYISAPLIADFYDNSILTPVIRIFCIRIPISSYNSIQHAYVSRHMMFKKFFYSTLGGTLVSAIVGIYLAYNGFGVWAIVGQYLTNTIIDSIVLSFTVPWRPKKAFSWSSAKNLMKYGWKVAGASFSGTFFTQLRSLIIGKFFTPADLAFYERGRSFASLATDNISHSLMTVLFPKFANSSTDIAEVKKQLQKTIRIMTYVLFPMIIGISLVSRSLVKLLLTEKWYGCIPYIQILCISAAIGLVGDVSLQAINAIGRSDVTLKLEFVKKPVYLILLVIGIKINVIAVAVTMLVYTLYATFANVSSLKKHLGYSLGELIIDLFPSCALTLIMAVAVLLIGMVQISTLGMLILQVSIGALVYIILSWITKNNSFNYFIDLIKVRMKKNEKSV